jgi:excisionase family DNA binding protein
MPEQLKPSDLRTLEWFTVRELSNRWKCSADSIRRMIDDGTLKAMWAGGWRLHESVIEQYEQKAKSAKAAPARRQRVPVGFDIPDRIGSI